MCGREGAGSQGQQYRSGQAGSQVSVSGICAAVNWVHVSLELLTETLLLSNGLGRVTGSKTSRSGRVTGRSFRPCSVSGV